jgi:hypothetical protein
VRQICFRLCLKRNWKGLDTGIFSANELFWSNWRSIFLGKKMNSNIGETGTFWDLKSSKWWFLNSDYTHVGFAVVFYLGLFWKVPLCSQQRREFVQNLSRTVHSCFFERILLSETSKSLDALQRGLLACLSLCRKYNPARILLVELCYSANAELIHSVLRPRHLSLVKVFDISVGFLTPNFWNGLCVSDPPSSNL